MPWQVPLQKARTRARLNLTVLVRISNRFSPHLGRKKGSGGGGGGGGEWNAMDLRVHRPFAAVRNPISARENFSFELTAIHREAPPFAARVNFVAREWINFSSSFFLFFAARKMSGDDWIAVSFGVAKRKRSIGLDISIRGKTELEV